MHATAVVPDPMQLSKITPPPICISPHKVANQVHGLLGRVLHVLVLLINTHNRERIFVGGHHRRSLVETSVTAVLTVAAAISRLTSGMILTTSGHLWVIYRLAFVEHAYILMDPHRLTFAVQESCRSVYLIPYKIISPHLAIALHEV